MEHLLLEFVATLDASLKKLHSRLEAESFSRLSISQLHYLEAVDALGEPTLGEIAAHLGLTRASATSAVQKLERFGLVVKTQSSQDRRAVHVRLTPAAMQLVAAKHQTIQLYGDFIRAALTPDEMEQFQHILSKLVRQFADSTLSQE